MKHLMYSFAIALVALLCFGPGNHAAAQGAYKIKSLRFYDTCKTQFFQIERNDTGRVHVETSYGDGTRDTNTFSPSPQWITHDYTAVGSYTAKFVLMNNTYDRLDSATIVADVSGCSLFSGLMYKDNNGNCVYDAGDKILYYPVQVQVDSAGYTIDTITAFGSFFYKALGVGKTYAFKVVAPPGTYSLTCPSTGVLSGVAPFGSAVHLGDFGFTCASPAPSGFDVAVMPYVRAGRHAATVSTSLITNSCLPKAGTITLTMDSKYPIYASYPAGGVVSGHTVTWSYSGLTMDSAQYFTVIGEVSPWLTVGDIVHFRVSATPLAGETDTTNNTYDIDDTVRLSWDPNDKHVLPQGNIKAGQLLTYTLNFENTGNAPAQNIHVMDTLSNLVEPQTVRVIAASHKMNLYRDVDPASGRVVLKFDFPNIMLKDSSHHGECDGSVTFTVNAKSSLPSGTVVTNRGGIYFDDNDVVLTNTTSSIVATMGIPDVNTMANLAVYPNPVHDVLKLNLAHAGDFSQLTIMNTVGQVIIQQAITGTDVRVNVSTLMPGIYFMLVDGNSGTRVTKIEKY